MIGTRKGACTRKDVNGYIKELHLGYYGGKIQRISFATSDQVYVTGTVNSKQSVQEYKFTEENQLIGLKATVTTIITSIGILTFETACFP